MSVARLLAVFTTRSELRKVPFLALSVTFLFVHEISREPRNGFAPNSQGRRVWSLARTSLNVKVKGQGHQGQGGIFRPCVRFMFGKTSSATSFSIIFALLLKFENTS